MEWCTRFLLCKLISCTCWFMCLLMLKALCFLGLRCLVGGLFFLFLFWLHHMPLVPQPGIKPTQCLKVVGLLILSHFPWELDQMQSLSRSSLCLSASLEKQAFCLFVCLFVCLLLQIYSPSFLILICTPGILIFIIRLAPRYPAFLWVQPVVGWHEIRA